MVATMLVSIAKMCLHSCYGEQVIGSFKLANALKTKTPKLAAVSSPQGGTMV